MARKPTSHNRKDTALSEVDVIVLCGGLGTRLRPVLASAPKVLAPLGESTFLDVLLDQLFDSGFMRIILGVGHMRDQVRAHITERNNAVHEILFSEEEEPLGTGGALRHARRFVQSEYVMAMNGDSLFDNFDFSEFYRAHKETNSLLSIALAHVPEARDCGRIVLYDNGSIASFEEKGVAGPALVNMGAYCMKKAFLDQIPDIKPCSLEKDVFPFIPSSERYGFVSDAQFIDIGTPERYEGAKALFRNA